MTKGRAAKALADAIIDALGDDDGTIRQCFSVAGLSWGDFDGAPNSRLQEAIRRSDIALVRELIREVKEIRGDRKEELTHLLDQFESIPGPVWDGEIAQEFIASCPYPGMTHFMDEKGFFGRGELTAQILKRLEETPLLLVTGASGSGKSSVMMAGVFPNWRVQHGLALSIRLDYNPFESIYVEASRCLEHRGRAEPFRESGPDYFGRLIAALTTDDAGNRTGQRPLLFLDQFERALAVEGAEREQRRDQFIAALVEYTQSPPAGARIVIGLRNDFLGLLGDYRELHPFTDNRPLRVYPLDEDGLREAIERPAADHGVQVDPDVVKNIIDGVQGRSGMLPLMQDLLQQLWKAEPDLPQSRLLRKVTYDTLGGVLGALTKKMDALCRTKDGQEDRQAEAQLRRILLQTVHVAADPKTPAISRVARKRDIAPADRELLHKLIDQHKVLVARESAESDDREGAFELPHESLLVNWPKLDEWIKEDRVTLYLANRLADDAAAWSVKRNAPGANPEDVDESFCWRGGRLEGILKCSRTDFPRLGLLLSIDQQRFLSISEQREIDQRDRELRQAREREEAAQRLAEVSRQKETEAIANALKQARLLRWARLAAAFAMLLAIVAGFFWWQSSVNEQLAIEKKEEAQRNLKRAVESELEEKKQRSLAEQNAGELASQFGESERRIDLGKLREAQFALAENNLELAESFLDSVKPEHRQATFDEKTYPCFVWHYLKRQCEGGLFTLYGHTDYVSSVAFSPDGTRIVTGSYDNTARVWDARTGRPVLTENGQPLVLRSAVRSVAYSPDGRRIVTGSGDETAQVWDAHTGRLLVELPIEDLVTSVAYLPDGQRIVTGSMGGKAQVWDGHTGRLLLKLPLDAEGSVTSVACSPDGQRIITGSRITGSAIRTGEVWDARTGQFLLELRLKDWFTSVAYSPDGQQIVTGFDDGTAQLWNAGTGDPLHELKHSTNKMSVDVAYSLDGMMIATGADDGIARIWDSRSGQLLLALQGHTGAIASVAFSPDGTRIVTGSSDGTAKIWDFRSQLQGASKGVTSVAFSPDGKWIVTGSDDNTARVWDARSGESLRELTGHARTVTSVAFSPDGKRVVTGGANDNTARVWDARSGESLRELTGHKGDVTSVAFSPDGTRIVTGSGDQTARVWDARSGESLRELTGHTGDVTSVAFSPDGTRIVTGSGDQTARVWDARSGESLRELTGHKGDVTSVAFSPDGTRIVTGTKDGVSHVWNALTGKSISVLRGHKTEVRSVAFAPDGQRIVTGADDGRARVWDALTGQTLLELTSGENLTSVAFSPDGERLVTGSSAGARLWEARSHNQIQLELQGNSDSDYVRHATYSPKGDRVAAGGPDGIVWVWDALTGQILYTLKGHTWGALVVVFSQDGQWIVSRNGGTVNRVWNASTGTLAKDAAIPPLAAPQRISPDGKFYLLPRFNKVLVISLDLSEEELNERKRLTRPLPRWHASQAKHFQEQGDRFAEQVHRSLEQQALGQERIDAGKPEEAQRHFEKAKELYPKLAPIKISPKSVLP